EGARGDGAYLAPQRRHIALAVGMHAIRQEDHVALRVRIEPQRRPGEARVPERDRKSTRLNSSHEWISYAVFCLKKKNKKSTYVGHRCLRHLANSMKSTDICCTSGPRLV